MRLEPHPQTQSDAVRSIDVRVGRVPGAMLAVTYVLEGDLDRLRIPPRQPARIGDRLWQHTCFEIFIRAEEAAGAYHEFNFSPSREWAAYAFERYREGAPLTDEALDPRVAVRNGAGRLELDASVDLERLSRAHASAKLALALSAVVEDADGSLSYWALAHPAGKPDFHHADGFALKMQA